MSRQLRFALKCVTGLLLFTASALLILEYLVLRPIERRAAGASPENTTKLITRAWQEENSRIHRNTTLKLRESAGEWVWSSAGHPVRPQRSARRRILIMGDSFIWGGGYANMNDLWWRQMERELRRQGYHDVEVIAAGENGASTARQLTAARDVIQRYRPDLVIWGYVTNDPDEGRIRQLDYEVARADRLLRLHRRVANRGVLPRVNFQLEQRRLDRVVATMPQEVLGYAYDDWEMKLLERDNLAVYDTTLRALADFMRNTGLPYFVMTLPNRPDEAYFRPRYGPVLPRFAAAGIPVVDILHDFAAAYPIRSPLANNLGWGINPADAHPGVVSTRFYAIQAVRRVRQQHPEALGPRAGRPVDAELRINDWMPVQLDVHAAGNGRVTFTYPADSSLLMQMPLGKPHALISLRDPVAVRSITLSGQDLAAAEAHLTFVDDSTGIDYGTLVPLPRRAGTAVQWVLPPDLADLGLNTVRIVAEFAGSVRRLALDVLPASVP